MRNFETCRKNYENYSVLMTLIMIILIVLLIFGLRKSLILFLSS